MKPRRGHRNEREAPIAPGQHLERMATPLTVLHANIQLLQRRIRNGHVPDPDGLLRILARLERASRSLSGELRELGDAISTDRRDHEMIDRNHSSDVRNEGERDT